MPTTGPLGPAIDAVRAGDYAKAEKELAAVKGAEQANAQLMLVRVLLDQGKFTEAEKAAAAVPAARKADVIPLRAEGMFHTGKSKDAIKLLDGVKDEKGVPGRRIRLLLGEYYVATGRRTDAEAPLMTIISDYNSDAIKETDGEGLAMVGRAAHLLRSYKDANEAFQQSLGADRKNLRLLLWHAELLLEKYNIGGAEASIRDAAKLAPKNPDVLVAMARIKLEQSYDFDSADKLVAEALKINPKHSGAHAVQSGLALRDLDIAASEKAIADGLATDPDELELLTMRAATRFLADDPTGYENAKKDVLSRNGEYSKMYGIIAEFAEWEHRYDDIVTMMQEALKVDPKDAKAQAQLALMQMRAGDDVNGLANLQKAFNRDKFNVRAYNTLNLYEKNLATDYDLVDVAPFKIRYPKRTEAVLSRYVPRLLGEAWGSMKARYGFIPVTPIQVELFEDATTQTKGFIRGAREQFAIRTSGLPNIGIQGVCFGKALAAMGPHSEPFNWGNVLWHELGHVFAIQLSKNHVPRWFTEGLSEYETIARRPEWQRNLDPQLYVALTKNRLPKAVDMNRAFTHAEDARDITVAYYAASQMMVFTVEQFGMPKVVEAMKLWGQGVRTPDVLVRAFGVSPSDYDAKFRAWAMGRLQRYKGQFIFDGRPKDLADAKAAVAKTPNSADAHTDLAIALVAEGDPDAASKEIDAALKLDPNHQTAHWLYMRKAVADHDREAAEVHLNAIRKAGGDGYAVQLMLANLAEAKKDKVATRAAFETAYKYDPTQVEPLEGLYDIAKEDKRDDDALDVLRKLAPIDQHDQHVWRALLTGLVEHKLWTEAAQVGEGAVFVDVGGAGTHVLFGKALAQTGDPDRALFEAESALVCADLKPKDAANAHALEAQVLLSQKKNADAKKHRDEALKLDPECADAKALVIP
jgi:tetratricopeptide (TPR) repeat protein